MSSKRRHHHTLAMGLLASLMAPAAAWAQTGAEQTLLDQRLFMVSGSQYQALMDLLDRPEQANEGLRDLFARKAPWDTK